MTLRNVAKKVAGAIARNGIAIAPMATTAPAPASPIGKATRRVLRLALDESAASNLCVDHATTRTAGRTTTGNSLAITPTPVNTPAPNHRKDRSRRVLSDG